MKTNSNSASSTIEDLAAIGSGGSGPLPRPDRAAPSVTVASPALNQAIATASFDVSGAAEDMEPIDDYDRASGVAWVKCSVEGTTYQATLTRIGGLQCTWVARNVAVPPGKKHGDALTIEVTCADAAGNHATPVPWTVIVRDTTAPVVGVDPVPPTVGTAVIEVTGTASDPAYPAWSDIQSVECSLNGGPFAPAQLTPAAGTARTWKARIGLPPVVPVAGTAHRVTVRSRDGAGTSSPVVATTPATFLAIDKTPPMLVVAAPANGDAFRGDQSGVTVPFSGTVDDALGGSVLSSGVSSVEARAYDVLIPDPNGGPGRVGTLAQKAVITAQGTWTASLKLPRPGTYQVGVWCADKAGNVFETPPFTIAATVGVARIDNPLSKRAYLADLLDFATGRLRTGNQQPLVTAALLTSTVHQDWDGTDEPIHSLRVVIEALRRFREARAGSGPIDESSYLQVAYETLLARLGTSYDELRFARSAPADKRIALARRLGIYLSDQTPELNELFVVPVPSATMSAEAIESALTRVFGYAPTRRAPGTPPPSNRASIAASKYVGWRRQAMRRGWRDEDAATPWLIVDPDALSAADFVTQTSSSREFALWSARQQTLQTRLTQLRTTADAILKNQGTPFAALQAVAKTTWQARWGDGSIAALDAMLARRDAGTSIAADLAAAGLSEAAFDRFMRIRDLSDEPQAVILESEWNDVFAILTQAYVRMRAGGAPSLYEQWKSEEMALGTVLDPTMFRPATLTPSMPGWGSAQQVRRDWISRLRARIDQDQNVVGIQQAVVEAAETAALPLLRDAIVRAFGSDSDLPDRLTRRLRIDVRETGMVKTTRVDQAVGTLQAILFAERTGNFTDADSVLGPDPAAAWVLSRSGQDKPLEEEWFDREWQWIGTYETWRAAMFVFMYPEALLMPAMQEARADVPATRVPTPAFQAFIGRLRGVSLLTPQRARDEAAQYLRELRADPQVPLPAPLLDPQFAITDRFTESQLAERRRALIAPLLTTYTTLDAVPSHLKEVFYFVPLHLALELQKAGHFLPALEWYQTVYAYGRPPAERKIFTALDLEPKVSDVQRNPFEWLLHSLNPHDFAPRRRFAHTRFLLTSLSRCLIEFADAEFTRATAESLSLARTLYLTAVDLLGVPEMRPEDESTGNPFPPNPIPDALRSRATLNLTKLRQGRNIAGMLRTADAPADGIYMPAAASAGTVVRPPSPIRPTPYYFSVLIERAKHLASLAQQMEAAYLAALEKFDAETYNLLKARHDLELAGKSVDLQALRVNQAAEGATLALRQQERVTIQKSTYDAWLQKPVSDLEQQQLASYRRIAQTQGRIAGIDASLSILQAWASLAAASSPGAIFGGLAMFALGGVLNSAKSDEASKLANQQADAQVYAQQASIERRTQEWRLQQALAAQDEQISEQQIAIARANESIAVEEQQIASLQQQHALAVVGFLASKFTSAELYAWMSGVLGQVYRYFLQQATSVARLAEQQLMFERQQATASLVQADYWEAPSDTSASTNTGPQDRRGITGSARLLQDIYQLDQFAFESNKRKLQLSQTLSLAQLFPQEFEEFRRTGRFVFSTPMSLFDRAFPGHYLRLIRRVRTSVVALVPPAVGIRATLTNSGISRAVIGGDVFHHVEIRREPDTVALTSPINASGVFEFDVQGDMMQPFEARGVHSNWELMMPKAANPFDYASIADVLITIDYTALHSEEYRAQVIASLDRSIEAERAFSFRNHFVDAWYALTNAEPGAPLSVSFEIDRGMLPPHLANVRLRHVALCFARGDGEAREVTVAALVAPNAAIVTQSPATSQDGLISTRRANGAGWQRLMGSDPVGQWKLTLADAAPTRELLTNGAIEDIVVLLTYSAETPAWV